MRRIDNISSFMVLESGTQKCLVTHEYHHNACPAFRRTMDMLATMEYVLHQYEVLFLSHRPQSVSINESV